MSKTSKRHITDAPNGLSKDIKKHLEKINEKVRNQPNSENSGGKVSTELCNSINDMYEDGATPSEILNYVPVSSPNTIYYHLRGDCSHDKRTKVTYDECGWMRFKARRGAPSKTIAILYNVSQRVAARHITGDCSHNHNLEPVSGDKLRQNATSGTKMRAAVCDECEEWFEYPTYRDRRFCSEACRDKYGLKKANGKL